MSANLISVSSGHNYGFLGAALLKTLSYQKVFVIAPVAAILVELTLFLAQAHACPRLVPYLCCPEGEGLLLPSHNRGPECAAL